MSNDDGAVKQAPMPALWHLYLIECADGSLYAGISTDVARRYQQHCAGKGAKYTRSRPPLRLLGSQPCGDRSAALKAEYAIRRLNRGQKLAYFAAPALRVLGREE